jgi:oxygen-dependent protoporphyrinogen oxidase
VTPLGRAQDLRHRSVAVVGGGITGLTAARRLARQGAHVTVYEAGPRLGGQVRTETVAGHEVDVGAEALHLGAPELAALLDELDLAGGAVTARPGRSWIWTGRRLRHLPEGVGPAGPTRLGPVLRSGVLSPRGVARAAAEPLVPRAAVLRRGGDVAVGTFVAGRFGRQVTDRLVDPVLGNLHAGDVSRLSLRSTTPQLAARATQHRSILLSHRGGPASPPPRFVSFRRGLATLTDAIVASAGVDVRVRAPVTSLRRAGNGYRLGLGAGRRGRAPDHDAVVLAVPPDAAAAMLGPVAQGAAAGLAGLRSASVVTVVAAYPRAAAEAAPALQATGMLVTSSAGRLLKAATFLGRKWPHLEDPDRFLVRLSAGRAGSSDLAHLDDGDLVERLHADLAEATGLRSGPVEVLVRRWPKALAQLEVGHQGRIDAVRRHLRDLPGVALAGAPYEGLGVGTCVGSGERAARAVAVHLADRDRQGASR